MLLKEMTSNWIMLKKPMLNKLRVEYKAYEATFKPIIKSVIEKRRNKLMDAFNRAHLSIPEVLSVNPEDMHQEAFLSLFGLTHENYTKIINQKNKRCNPERGAV
ncbi:unnamed protein product [Ceutorhynchus assimilis]|uniref:Uncharacterized protein n=1 Tax=Ceutorhynchus assimilis TaxID=467358 RepID=A0A9N9Q9F7_9CUCU|nr:unnamed protein product [Ceutorhynchus assimilis]